MPTALHARELQQQWLLEDLLSDAVGASEKFPDAGREEEQSSNRFLLLAAHEILKLFVEKSGGPLCRSVNDVSESAFVSRWVKGALGRIEGFTRTNEETNLLRSLLIKKLVDGGTNLIWLDYVVQARGDSMKALGVSRCTDEVPMPQRG